MIQYLTVEQVIETHHEMIQLYGGLPGIRDKNLLSSAVDAPKAALFGKEMYPSVYQKSAAYLYHIVCNHPFNDANKRTGFAATLLFMKINNVVQLFKKKIWKNLLLKLPKEIVQKKK